MVAGTAKRVAIACLLASALPLPAQDQKPVPRKLTLAEKEEFLRTAEVKGARTLGEGVTESQRMTLEKDGFRHDAHFQKIDENKLKFEGRGVTEMNFKDSWKFNVAGYELAKLLGIEDMVPPSVQRKHGGSTGAFTWWVDDVALDEKKRLKGDIVPPDLQDWNAQMWVVRLFDQLIYNTDRNMGNLLITKDWRIWMIDHTRAFRSRTDLRAPKNISRCDRKLLARMRELDKPALQKALSRYLTGVEITGLLSRNRAIVKLIDSAVKDRGEQAVLYDRVVRD